MIEAIQRPLWKVTLTMDVIPFPNPVFVLADTVELALDHVKRMWYALNHVAPMGRMPDVRSVVLITDHIEVA
jgi:hypothetical protein